jgi:hypothetical protein
MYDAFISYSQANDSALAEALQSVLQRLGKAFYQRAALSIFRDVTALAPTPALWSLITSAMERSRFFIYIASPEAVSSLWVCREVDWWLTHKGTDNLIIVLADGTLVWNSDDVFLSPVGAPVLPTSLQRAFHTQPLWLDMRRYRYLAPSASKTDDEFISLVAGISAAIRGVPKETVFSDELRQQRKVLTIAWSTAGALGVLILIVALVASLAVYQRNRSEAILSKTTKTANGLVFDLSERFRNQLGDPDVALAILDQARQLTEELLESGEFRRELAVNRAAAIAGLSEIYNAKDDFTNAIVRANETIVALTNVQSKFDTDQVGREDFRVLMGIAFERLGDALLGQKRLNDAEQAYKTSLSYYEKQEMPSQGSAKSMRSVAVDLEKLGRLYLRRRDHIGALASFKASHKLRTTLAEGFSSAVNQHEQATRDLAISFGNLGSVLSFPENKSAYLSSVQLARDLLAAHPETFSYKEDLAVSLRELGESYAVAQQRPLATQAFQEAIVISGELTLCRPERSDLLMERIASVLGFWDVTDEPKDPSERLAALQGEADSSEAHLRRHSNSDGLKQTMSNLFLKISDQLVVSGRPADARQALQRAIELRKQVYFVDANALEARGHLYLKMSEAWVADKQPERALRESQEWLEFLRKAETVDENHMRDSYNSIAWYAVLSRRADLALSASAEALARDKEGELAIQANRAHALMIAQSTEDARSIYLANIGKTSKLGETWEAYLMKDFDVMRSFNIDSQLMRDIYDRFSASSTPHK